MKFKTKTQLEKKIEEEQIKCVKFAWSHEKNDWSSEHFNYCESDVKSVTLIQTNEFESLIKNIEDPYPTDVFLEIDEKIIPLIDKWLKKELGFPLDRLSAHIGRKVRKNLQQEILTKIKGEEE